MRVVRGSASAKQLTALDIAFNKRFRSGFRAVRRSCAKPSNAPAAAVSTLPCSADQVAGNTLNKRGLPEPLRPTSPDAGRRRDAGRRAFQQRAAGDTLR